MRNYNILVDKFKFKVIADTYVRKYKDNMYQFYYYEGMLRLTKNNHRINDFYNDIELFDFLSKTFPKEARYEKLKIIL